MALHHQLTQDGVKLGKWFGRFPFASVLLNRDAGSLTLECDTGLVNRSNTPGKPACYMCPDIFVFGARDRKPFMWFSLPADVFFMEFQPWHARVTGAAVAHEYDEIDCCEAPQQTCTDDDALTLTLSEEGCNFGCNVHGRKTKFRHIKYSLKSRTISLYAESQCRSVAVDGSTAEFFTFHAPVTVYREQAESEPKIWFSLAPRAFFEDFMPWWCESTKTSFPKRCDVTAKQDESDATDLRSIPEADIVMSTPIIMQQSTPQLSPESSPQNSPLSTSQHQRHSPGGPSRLQLSTQFEACYQNEPV